MWCIIWISSFIKCYLVINQRHSCHYWYNNNVYSILHEKIAKSLIDLQLDVQYRHNAPWLCMYLILISHQYTAGLLSTSQYSTGNPQYAVLYTRVYLCAENLHTSLSILVVAFLLYTDCQDMCSNLKYSIANHGKFEFKPLFFRWVKDLHTQTLSSVSKGSRSLYTQTLQLSYTLLLYN